MCGFLVFKDKGNNSYIKRRGKDLTKKYHANGFTFVHNLLHITGKMTPQPFVEDGIVCVFNGEIYNLEYEKSDGENIIPLYKRYGPLFPRYLDGEWAIALYDFNKNRAIFATDLFATKPLWRNGLECGSYKSGVGGYKIPANTIEIVQFNSSVEKTSVFDWNMSQHKTDYSDWIKAFTNSVKKRVVPGCFTGMSSGYDSGAIVCELIKQRADFKAYIIEGKEDKKILVERTKLLSSYDYLDKNTDYKKEKIWIDKNVEYFKYKGGGEKSLHDDSASFALSAICRLAHSEGRKVYISGQGADEIFSDYAFWPKQSTFKGVFPDKLTSDLWENFYEGCQYSYLGKEEYVAGSHSIETRYPFLDKDVVQEFLWLHPKLKNKNYKAPIYEYLKQNNFPFSKDVKIGLGVEINR